MGSPSETSRIHHFIAELNAVTNRGVELSQLLETIAREVGQLLDADATTVMLLDPSREYAVASASHGLAAPERELVRVNEGINAWVATRGVPALIGDAMSDSRWKKSAYPNRDVRSALAVPLCVRRQPIGLILATHPQGGRFNREHEELLTFLANSVAFDLEHARLYRVAISDPETGVYSRQYLAERLKAEVERSHRYHIPLTVLFLEPDHVHEVGEQFGPSAGGRALGEVATRITAMMRETDLVGRYTSEQFVVLLPNTEREGAEIAARRLLESIRATPVGAGAGAVTLTVSIGGSVLSPHEEARDLLVRAEAALFQAQREGRNRFAFSWLSSAGSS